MICFLSVFVFDIFMTVTFKDDKMAKEIMKASCPKQMKKFGRKVQNFDKDIWNRKSREVVRRASMAKVCAHSKHSIFASLSAATLSILTDMPKVIARFMVFYIEVLKFMVALAPNR